MLDRPTATPSVADTDRPTATINPPDSTEERTSVSKVIPPTPASSEIGTVTGVLMRDGESLQPVDQAFLYLGTVLTLSDGTPATVRLNKHEAPKTQIRANGQFFFADVPAGKYVLMMDLIVRTIALNNPETGSDFIIEVQGGEVTDLGTLVYENLPEFP